MDIETLFKEFAEEYGISDFHVGESGEITLLFDESIPITVQTREADQQFGFYAPLFPEGDVTGHPKCNANLYRDILEYSFLGKNTMGLAVSLNSEDNTLLIWCCVPIPTFSHGSQFRYVFNRFLSVIPAMQKYVLDYVENTENSFLNVSRRNKAKKDNEEKSAVEPESRDYSVFDDRMPLNVRIFKV